MAMARQALALAMIGAAWAGTMVAAPLAHAKGHATSLRWRGSVAVRRRRLSAAGRGQ
jgi:hypothetical protein